jgi:catechol 2,3-dioxygenase-like lactoylglutathione lyase family enzyme
MNARLAVISLWAEDVSLTVHFYRDVLGLRLLPHHGDRPHFDLDGVYLVILKGTPNPAPTRFPLVAFAVNDLDAAIAHLRTHRVDLPWGIEEDAGSRWVMLRDPAGNLIELAYFKRRSD